MRSSTDHLFRLRPWSLPSFVLALASLFLATALQTVLTSFGAPLHFATFFPAILLASVLGGTPAGAFAAALTVPIVWWAFIPPHFEFNALTSDDYHEFIAFLLFSSLAIWLSQLYREAVAILRK